MIRYYICPRCKRSNSRNYGRSRRVDKTGKFEMFRRCRMCNCPYRVEVSVHEDDISGFVRPDRSQTAVVVASGARKRGPHDYIIAVNEAWKSLPEVPDLLITGCSGYARNAPDMPGIESRTGQRLAIFWDNEWAPTNNFWAISTGFEAFGYWPADPRAPQRHGNESGIAALCWAMKQDVNLVALSGFTRPTNTDRWSDVFKQIKAHKEGLPLLDLSESPVLRQLWDQS